MSRKKIVNEKVRGKNKGGNTMSKDKIERKLSELEIEKNQTLKEIGKMECDYCVDLTSRYTDTSEWESADQYIYNDLERIYRELTVKIDRYTKQLKKLEG